MAKSKTINLLNLNDVKEAIKEIENKKATLNKVNKLFLVACSEWLKKQMDFNYQASGGKYPLIDESTNNFIYNIGDDFKVDLYGSKGTQFLTLTSISQQTTYAEFGIGAVGKNYSKGTNISYKYDVDSPYKKTPRSGGSRFWFHKGPDDDKAVISSGKVGLYFAYDSFWELVNTGVLQKLYEETYKGVK